MTNKTFRSIYEGLQKVYEERVEDYHADKWLWSTEDVEESPIPIDDVDWKFQTNFVSSEFSDEGEQFAIEHGEYEDKKYTRVYTSDYSWVYFEALYPGYIDPETIISAWPEVMDDSEDE